MGTLRALNEPWLSTSELPPLTLTRKPMPPAKKQSKGVAATKRMAAVPGAAPAPPEPETEPRTDFTNMTDQDIVDSLR